MLVYEYIQNGTLVDQLGSSLLNWPTRYKIAIDIAKGLYHLHYDCVPPIIHRDLKSSNILLDEAFNAKLADFGLSKTKCEAESTLIISSTVSYIAPG